MSPQPRNTKIMRREGPWGRAGWFPVVSDLDRCHSWAPGGAAATVLGTAPPQPATSPRPGRWRFRQAPSRRQPPHQVGAGRPQSVTQSGSG